MIYPKPQRLQLDGEIIVLSSNKIALEGDSTEYAQRVLCSLGCEIDPASPYRLVLEKRCTRETAYVEKSSVLTDEKYFLNISKDEKNVTVQVLFAHNRGLFRALNTLARLVRAGVLRCGTAEDYPLFSRRGYIEGFYGSPWSDESRRGVMALLAKHGMNTFFYAPKDDVYHRARWRDAYPEEELEKLRDFAEFAALNEVDFHWCIAPGLTIRYTDDADFDALFAKIASVARLGVKGIGLLLDDIPQELNYAQDRAAFAEAVDAHISLANRVFARLRELYAGLEMTVCPMQYHGKGNEYYISKFASSLAPEIHVFWTGEEICSRELTAERAYTFVASTAHRPLYWDNFPVNDAEMLNEMHLSPLMGRDEQLFRYSDGLISNVMEYAECSKIPMLTVADYLWNPPMYDAAESYDAALGEVLGGRKKLFGYFADHLQVSCLTKESSVLMSDTLAHVAFLLSSGSRGEALAKLEEYAREMRKCALMLESDELPIFAELRQWSRKFSRCCTMLEAAWDYLKKPDGGKRAALAQMNAEYHAEATALTGFCFREFVEKIIAE